MFCKVLCILLLLWEAKLTTDIRVLYYLLLLKVLYYLLLLKLSGGANGGAL